MKVRANAVPGLLALAIIVAVVMYVGDDLFVRYRAAHPQPGSPLETVTFFYGTTLKNGKLEIFRNDPHTEVCVHALFPHLGANPCWYVTRQKLRLIGAAPRG